MNFRVMTSVEAKLMKLNGRHTLFVANFARKFWKGKMLGKNNN